MRLLTLLAVCMLVLSGCPKEKRALNAARVTVGIAAQTVNLVDAEVASLYREAAVAALDGCDTRACYNDTMKRWDKTVRGVATMKNSLLLVETSLDAWEAGSPNGRASLREAAGCFFTALVQLQDTLADLGASASALDHGIQYGSDLFGLGGTSCPAVSP